MARLFLAIRIPEQVQNEIEKRFYPLLGRFGKKLKPVLPQNLHITLCFLGEQPLERTEPIRQKLDWISQVPKFEIKLKGAGTFQNRVLWIGIPRASAQLKTLARKAAQALKTKPEKKAHLTIARNKSVSKPQFRELRQEIRKKEWTASFAVSTIELLESKQKTASPQYSIKTAWVLRKQANPRAKAVLPGQNNTAG